jgi:hypothetical protein
MTTKKISFVTKGKNESTWELKNITLTEIRVDLNQLSPTARIMAECVLTTANDDDFSTIHIRDPQTYWDRLPERQRTERMREAYGSTLDEHPVIRWTWDTMKQDETGEAYLERHARAIEAIGGTIIVPEKKPFDRTAYNREYVAKRRAEDPTYGQRKK